jgi:UDP-glucuronate 4-epimerase
MTRILVTGAAGFIGSHVCEALLARGDEVLGIDNFDPFYAAEIKQRNLLRSLENPAFQFENADIRDIGAAVNTVRKFRPSSVIHLAAKAGVRPSIDDPIAYIETNVLGLQALLSALTQSPVERFVFASSSSVYGDRSDPPFRETDRTDEPASPYAATKKAGEALCHTFHSLTGTPVSCLRFFTVYGPRQRPDLAIHKFTKLIDSGMPVPFFGDGSTSRDYTFVTDTVHGVLGALDNTNGFETFNLGRRDPVTLSDMVETLEAVLDKKAILDRRPTQPGDVTTTCADTTKAKQAFGYDPKVTFAEGIDRFVAWWKSERGS